VHERFGDAFSGDSLDARHSEGHSHRISKTEVHVCTIDLDRAVQNPNGGDEILTLDEIERASRFRLDLHRNRFLRCRRALRRILANSLRCTPNQIHFQYGDHGKPCLDGLHFNVAHSDGLALIAVSHAGEVGIDVEAVRWLDDFDALVARFFCSRESRLFARLPNELKPVAFFNLWTRKEAILKATGEGIAHSLNRVDVTFLPDEPPCVLSMPNDNSWCDWTLKTLAPAPGYIGALAIKNSSAPLELVIHELQSD